MIFVTCCCLSKIDHICLHKHRQDGGGGWRGEARLSSHTREEKESPAGSSEERRAFLFTAACCQASEGCLVSLLVVEAVHHHHRDDGCLCLCCYALLIGKRYGHVAKSDRGVFERESVMTDCEDLSSVRRLAHFSLSPHVGAQKKRISRLCVVFLFLFSFLVFLTSAL